MNRSLALYALLLCCSTPVAAQGRAYSAERYDSRIEVEHGGTLRVTETITLRFEAGTFKQFYRMVPARLTDGIEIVAASMDGEVLPAGEGPGQVQISGSSRIRVTWHFAPASNSTHTFQLIYLARGVVRQEPDADVCVWRILPTEHNYRIASTAAEIILPDRPLTPPTIEVRRVGESSVTVDGSRVQVLAGAIRGNGWIDTTVRLPRGSAIDAPPAWQQHAEEVDRLSRGWLVAAGIVLVAGLALVLFVRQRYDSPPRELPTATRWSTPPDELAPVLAGTLLTNGAPRLEHAMAAMFSLAEREELRIEEHKSRFGQRTFEITRTTRRRPLEPFEQRLLEIVFGADQGAVSLAKARTRLVRQFKKFTTALEPVMASAGLLDEDRKAVRRRFGWIAGVCGILAGLVPIPLGFAVERYGGWPMLIALALAIVALVAVIAYAAHTPLSNDGVRRGREWRVFRQYLRDVACDREASPGDTELRRLLPYAVALGVASSWSTFLKRHRSAVPPWFHAASDTSSHTGIAFAAFVASGGTGMGGHGSGHGSGGAAGGGASGAS